jgi:F-type H+-transporting ATPase subunit b
MQIDWWTLALQTINFLVVVWLLSRFLYRPVQRIIAEREAASRKAAQEAEAKAEAAETTRKDYEEKRAALAEAERKRDAELHAEVEKERQAMLEAARKEATELVDDARARIERERAEALEALRDRIAGLAEDLAAKALAAEAAAGGDDLGRVVQHLDALPEPDLSELRHDLDSGKEALVLASARALPEAEKEKWREALTARFGEGIRLDFTESADLLGGVELRFPHAVLAFSVAGRLRRAAAEMKE